MRSAAWSARREKWRPGAGHRLAGLRFEQVREPAGRRLDPCELRGLLVFRQGGVAPDRGAVGGEHGVDRPPILPPEVEIAEVEEGRSLEPALDQVEERGLLLRSLDARGIVLGEARRVGSVVELEAVPAPHPQLVLDQAELNALKARGRDQVVAEIEEVERRHGLQHVDLLNQDALDLDDAPEPQDRLPERLPPGTESRRNVASTASSSQRICLNHSS